MFMARTPEQNNAIITGSIPRQLLLFFFPIWLGTMFQQLYNTVDTPVSYTHLTLPTTSRV